jgi:hypothetical protein
MENYRIGWLSVWMTKDQAERWNSGDTTRQDMFTIIVSIPSTDRGLPISEEMTLAESMRNPMVRETVKGNWSAVPYNS